MNSLSIKWLVTVIAFSYAFGIAFKISFTTKFRDRSYINKWFVHQSHSNDCKTFNLQKLTLINDQPSLTYNRKICTRRSAQMTIDKIMSNYNHKNSSHKNITIATRICLK